MPYTYKLILKSGPNAGTEYALEKDEVILGRDAKSDVVINDAEVSRRHARLIRNGEDYFYEDLGSTNGSFIQGARLSTMTLLKPGMTINIGETVVLSYMMTSSDPSATVASKRRQAAPVPTFQTPAAPPPPIAPPVYVAPPQAPVVQASVTPGNQNSKTMKIILIIVAAIVVLCVIPSIIMEASNTWCNILGGIFNLIKSGSCPIP
jgi:pSer/pThr/pTyr-binding forkhead associated (FHA) protein